MTQWTTLVLAGTAFLGADSAGLPFPAVQILEGPPTGNYCDAERANALFNVNTQPGELYAAQGTFKVDGEVVYVSAMLPFSFSPGVQAGQVPLPREVLPDSTYPAGTVFSTTTRYFDAAANATYENEITIVCDTGEAVLIRNSNLDFIFADGFE